MEVVLALLRAKEIADFTDGAPEGVDSPDGAGSQKGLQLPKAISIGLWSGVYGGRNKSQVAPMARTACSATALLWAGKLSRDDDVARLEGQPVEGLDVSFKNAPVHRRVND